MEHRAFPRAGTLVPHRGGCAMHGGHADLLSRDQVVMTAGERTPEPEMCQVCSQWGNLGIEKPRPARKRSGGMS
ncbi:hypothetical protein ACF09C_00005 [Streptomyces sp. NPDC014870]|uniref:hypothetical protein n=1 Tax=Streptomyces sp. NPDC014870 TaxID=3364925 RepID=UPI0036F673A7